LSAIFLSPRGLSIIDLCSISLCNNDRSTTESLCGWGNLENPADAQIARLQLGFNHVVLIHSAKVRIPRDSPTQGINVHLLEILIPDPCELQDPLQPHIPKLQHLTIRPRSPANLEGYLMLLLKCETQTVTTHPYYGFASNHYRKVAF